MVHSKRILIITDQSLKPIKFFIDQVPKLAKGLIRLGHDARIISYSQVLRAASPFKSRRFSAYLYKKKVDQEIVRLKVHYQPDINQVGVHLCSANIPARHSVSRREKSEANISTY